MEKLKPLYDSETDIPKEYASLYEEKDGKFILTGIDGIKTQADIDKVLAAKKNEVENSKTLKKELDELKKSYEGIDTSEYKVLKEAHDKAALLKIDPKADLDKVKLKKDLEDLMAKHETATTTILGYENDKKQTKKEKALLIEARKLNLDPQYDEDVLLRTSFLDISEAGDVLTTDGKTVAELIAPLAVKFGLPSNGSGASTPQGSPASQDNRATAYAEAKKAGDTKGMIRYAPEQT